MSCGETKISEDVTLTEGTSMEDPLPEEHRKEKKTDHRVCGICGDVAKCYHFGGLCCDSCKSFFRRSIQGESWETFLCVKGGGCDIHQNRKACQACRFEMCKKNGMDPSLVMNAEERKALLLRKLEKRKQLLLMNRRLMDQQQKSNNQENENKEQQESNMDCDDIRAIDTENTTETYCPADGNDDKWNFTETLTQKNQEKIKGLRKILRKALTFPEFPKHYYEGGTDMTEHLFFVFCKGLGKYFNFVPEFQELDRSDKSVLLKDAVAKSIFIYGAHQFQEDLECWPRMLLSPECTFPTITLAATENFIGDDDTFFMMKTFMRKFCRFFDDEIVTLLSLMISVFDTDIPFLIDASKVTEYKESYTRLMVNYLRHQNANFSVSLFMSELSDCLSEVKVLKESFQRDRSKEEDVKPLRADEKTSFASSLLDLGEDPKMAPKKAFFERIKVKKCYNSSDIVPRDKKCVDRQKIRAASINTIESDEDVMMVSELPADPSFIVTQDHNYQKLNPSYSHELKTSNKFQPPEPPEEEVQILGAYGWADKTCPEDREYVSSSLTGRQKPKGVRSNRMVLPQFLDNFETQDDLRMTNESSYQPFSSRQPSPAIIIPISRTRSSSFSNNTGMGVHQNRISYSDEIEIDSPVYCSRQSGFNTVHPTNIHGASFLMPMSSQPSLPVGSSAGFIHEGNVTSGNMPVFHSRAVPTLALKTMPIHLPVNNSTEICGQAIAHQYAFAGHVNTASEMHITSPSYSQSAEQPSRTFSNRVLQTAQPNRHMSRQSPVSNVCHNMSQLSTQDDKQLVEVAQSVLPPHLMKHLITRLGTGQREQL
ncbi:uncharacterized protein [Palaemon carinicauda]|uniref:uncharacterized protein n=1 Tax=Palaemon carinicauda TaxID=392227 RepID=UPI0035B6946D